MALQDKTSPYDTDIFADAFEMLPKDDTGRYLNDNEENKKLLTNIQNTPDARIFVDHIRTSLLLIHSGITPSNT